MMWVFLTLVFLLGLVLWLPVEVEVDTNTDVYRICWKGIFGLRAEPGEDRWRLFFQIFFVEKEWRPGATKKPVKKPEPSKPARKKQKQPLSPRRAWQLFKNMLHVVELRHCRISWDTDDYTRNAVLFPLFFLLSKGKRRLAINFNGRQELQFLLQTRPYRLAGAVLRTFIHL